MKSKKYVVYWQCTPSVQSVFWYKQCLLITFKPRCTQDIFLPIHKDLTCLPTMLVFVLLCLKRFLVLYRAQKGSRCCIVVLEKVLVVVSLFSKRLHNWCQPLCGAIPRAWFHTRPNSKPKVFIFVNLYNLGPIESAPWLSLCIWASEQRLVEGDTFFHQQ